MRVAVLQMQAVPGDVDANLTRIGDAAARASDMGARVLVAPELALGGYGAGEAMAGLSPGDAPLVHLGAMAEAHDIAIVAGFAEKGEACLHNSAAFVTGGAAPVIYRKSHLYGPYEKDLFDPAAPQTVIVTLGGLKIGMLICYDVEFPENVRRLALAGADLIAVPTALPLGPDAAFIASTMVPVRAFENQLFIAYADNCGTDGCFAYQGMSTIVAPDGTALASAPVEGDALIVADVDPDAFAASRERNSYLRDLDG
jgi:predicted amidohydrolase